MLKRKFACLITLELAIVSGFFAANLYSKPLEMEAVGESVMDGRKVIRYEHDSIAEWGYQKPQRDYFYVIPAVTSQKKAPLRVVLHSAGHSGDKVLADAFKHPDWEHYYSDKKFHVLYLDCRKNGKVDWWWGYDSIKKTPEQYKDKLFPTEKWVINKYNVDRNRIYLSGISMGGSGSLGIGVCRGDIFAAISVDVPAEVNHMKFRTASGKHPDPPVVVNFSSHTDNWSRDQKDLMSMFKEKKYPLVYSWGPFGHVSSTKGHNPAVREFPWLSIRKDQAYPVFTNADTDDKYPGFKNKTDPDQHGQINGYFRWRNIADTPDVFQIELRLVKTAELKEPCQTPDNATADVTLRRLQKFAVVSGKTYKWSLMQANKCLGSGQVQVDANGLLTIPKVKITQRSANLKLEMIPGLPGRQVKTAAICIGFGGDYDKKMKLATEHLHIAGKAGVDIACLPEEFAGTKVAEPMQGPTTKAIGKLARQYNMYVICPIREQAGDKQYNTAVLLDRKGKIAGYYRKVFVFWGEGLHVSEEGVKAFDSDFGRIAILTCFDLNFAELWQDCDNLGAEIVFWPSAYGGGMPLNAFAMLYHYYVVPVGNGNIIDITGEQLETEKPIEKQYITTLDLDRTIIHSNFNGSKIEKLLKDYQGRVIKEHYYDQESWHLLKSVEPGVRVRDLCKQYEIETLRKYQHRSRKQINQARKQGKRI